MAQSGSRKRVPRQRRYPCRGEGISARIDSVPYAVDNFSRYGVALSVAVDRRSFPAQFDFELILEGQVVHRTRGHFRHRQVAHFDTSIAQLGISLADELQVEVVLGTLAARTLARGVEEQVGLLRELVEPLRAALEHVFLLFSELTLSLTRLPLAFPELSSREQHHFRVAFLATSARETAAVLKEIGNALDLVWFQSDAAQQTLFLSATRKRLAPFFERILPQLGKNADLPLLYPGVIDLRETRAMSPFEGEDLLSSLLSTLLLECRTVDAAVALESRMADALVEECRLRGERALRTSGTLRILFLCSGFGRIVDGFLSSREGLPTPKLAFVFADFLEPPLLRSQAALQKAATRCNIQIENHFEQHLTSDAADSPFEDLVLGLDLRKWDRTFDVIVCPWLADHLPSASRMALLVKLQATLAPGGACLLGKTPPPRPVHDLWPFLIDWERQTQDRELFLASIPSSFLLEEAEGERNVGRHWILTLRQQEK